MGSDNPERFKKSNDPVPACSLHKQKPFQLAQTHVRDNHNDSDGDDYDSNVGCVDDCFDDDDGDDDDDVDCDDDVGCDDDANDYDDEIEDDKNHFHYDEQEEDKQENSH